MSSAPSLPFSGPTLPYVIVDVFVPEGGRPFSGNPLAVVLGGDQLRTEQCQALAVEFHLSETVFALPATSPDATYRARIFTITSELPYAGHPSVGVAWTLAKLGRIPAGQVVQECGAGLLALEVPGGAGLVTLTGPVPAVSEPIAPGPLLSALGLSPDDHHGPAPRVCGTGTVFAFLPVRRTALARIRPDLGALGALEAGVTGIFAFALDDEPGGGSDLAVQARMFAADIGGEDPATGSAAIALGGFLVASGAADAGSSTRYAISQGVEMGRPSALYGTVTCSDGVIERVRVSGEVALVAQGSIAVPAV